MTPVKRALSGTALVFDLAAERRTVREQVGASGRSARTLLKSGPLRVTIVGLGAGGALAPHRADGPITIQVVEGEVELEAGGQRRALGTGSLVALDAGVEHAVRSEHGGIFLLTVVAGEGGPAPAA